MASSDDELDNGPQSVSGYYFVDEDEEVISFAELPIQWSKSESSGGNGEKEIFLRGTADTGLMIYMPVKAWKFDLSNAVVEISVLTKENNWIKLQKPRKSFEQLIRTVLITLQCLHFGRRKPEASKKSVWDYISREFRSHEVKPSESDLVDHQSLIREAVKRDDLLANCKFLDAFLEKPVKKVASKEMGQASTLSKFIVDDANDDIEDSEDGSDVDDDLFDSVCAFCDNGGDLLCCDGRCMRSFHATKEAGTESLCESLGFTAKKVEAMQTFECKNCKYKQHQCFACGKLGSSDKSSDTEVFQCASATCGYFYHPHCVAKLLHPNDKVAAEELQQKIVEGESVTCPVHKCCICKQLENKKEYELQFAVCRRCPTSYHRKCLPREIAFEDVEEEEIITRAWEDLLPGRILIYCINHEIDDDIGTPVRDHIRFPDVEEKRVATEQTRKQMSDLTASKGVSLLKKRNTSEGCSARKTVVRSPKESASAPLKVEVAKKVEKISSGPDSSRKRKSIDAPKSSSKENLKSSKPNVNKPSLGDRLTAKKSEQVVPGRQDKLDSEHKKTVMAKTVTKKFSTKLPSLDADSERRLLNSLKDVASSITLEDVVKRHGASSTHFSSSRSIIEKITLGKVEGAIEAVKTALKKLDQGCNIEDVKAVCECEVLNQIFKWKSKLRVYLAPFLYGMRYTSFGRHFTKVEKLHEIVDILHWYVKEGDTIVDFCCGANDFSFLMNKKLEDTGKKCLYKNYDLFQPKIDFNFEKRNWMSVSPEELPNGSQLIMGLNPPFGVKASLANKFINKALEFKPKLLILIVPPETERLDRKRTPYDLVWEDGQFLSGKSFYLPGSVDVDDKQMDQWNKTPPPLYLWSRRDWVAKHRDIALKLGHPSNLKKEAKLETSHHDIALKLGHPSIPKNEAKLETSHHESACRPMEHHSGESQGSYGPGINCDTSSKKMRLGDEKVGRGMVSEDEQIGQEPLVGNTSKGRSNVVDGRSSLDRLSSRSFETIPRAEAGEHHNPYLERGSSGPHQQHRADYHGSRANSQDNMDRRYTRNSDEFYSGGVDRYHWGANSEVHYPVYMRDSSDSVGYRSYVEEIERQRQADRQQSHSRYFGAEESFLVNHDLPYGRAAPPPPADPYARYLHPTAAASPRMSMPVMNQYAPRLDEMTHARMGGFSSEPPMLYRNDIYDPRPPQPGYQIDSAGFAPGPYHPYHQHHNSAGWLND